MLSTSVPKILEKLFGCMLQPTLPSHFAELELHLVLDLNQKGNQQDLGLN